MIAKGKAIAHGGNAINYAMREGKMDEIVGRNMIEGDTPAEILCEFETVNQYNYRCKNKYLRFEIGIAPQDADKLTHADKVNIAHSFASKMGLQNHQWIACTHKDTKNLHIHLIANRIGVDGNVFDTTFMSNRSARIAEEISKEMGLTIANDVHRQKPRQDAYTDRNRQRAKEKLQQIAYFELRNNTTLKGFLYGLERKGVDIEPAKNRQGKTYGIRFCYEGHTFKASEIGREFGYHSIAKNFSFSSEQEQSQQVQHSDNQSTANHQHSYSGSDNIESLLSGLFVPSGYGYPADDYQNDLHFKKKKRKKHSYGRQQ